MAATDGFEFLPPGTAGHTPGAGHVHLRIDGRFTDMVFDPVAPIPALEPGVHVIGVELVRNDHLAYTVEGRRLTSEQLVRVPGEPPPPDRRTAVARRNGEVAAEDLAVAQDDLVEIIVESDEATVVVIDALDIRYPVPKDGIVAVRFVADRAGAFPVEFADVTGEVMTVSVG